MRCARCHRLILSAALVDGERMYGPTCARLVRAPAPLPLFEVPA